MAEVQLSQEIRALRSSMSDIAVVLRPAEIEREIVALEQQAADPKLWDDQAKAQDVTSKLARAKSLLERLGAINSGLDDLEVLIEMANAEADEGTQKEAVAEFERLQAAIAALETQTLLNGAKRPLQARGASPQGAKGRVGAAGAGAGSGGKGGGW